MTRETQDRIHVLVQREDGTFGVEETTPAFREEPWEEWEPIPEDEPEPEDGGRPSFTPGRDGKPGVIRLGGAEEEEVARVVKMVERDLDASLEAWEKPEADA